MTVSILLCLLGCSVFISAQVNLGSAASFAVLSGASVTNTGPSVILGDIGTGGTAITGFPPGICSGSLLTSVTTPLTDATSAYNAITPYSGDDLTGQNLGGLVLGPGTYSFSSSAQLTGLLTLSSSSNSNASWYFKIGSALTTASGSSVLLEGTARACNVYWQVGSSATFGTGTNFVGVVLAKASITMTTGATSNGGLFALTGSVTLDTNVVHVADCSVSSMLSSSSVAGGGGGRGGASSITPVPKSLLTSTPILSSSSIAGGGGGGGGAGGASSITPAPRSPLTSTPRVVFDSGGILPSTIIHGDVPYTATTEIQNVSGSGLSTKTMDTSKQGEDITGTMSLANLHSDRASSTIPVLAQSEIYTPTGQRARTETEITYASTSKISFEILKVLVLGTRTSQQFASTLGLASLTAYTASATASNENSQIRASLVPQTHEGGTKQGDQYIDFMTMVETFIATASCTSEHSAAESLGGDMVGQGEIGEVITNVEAVTIQETCTCQHQHQTTAAAPRISGNIEGEGVSASSWLGAEDRATDIASISGQTTTALVPTDSTIASGQGARTNWVDTILGYSWGLLFVYLALE